MGRYKGADLASKDDTSIDIKRAVRGLCPGCGHPPHDKYQAEAIKRYNYNVLKFREKDAEGRLGEEYRGTHEPQPPAKWAVFTKVICPACGAKFRIKTEDRRVSLKSPTGRFTEPKRCDVDSRTPWSYGGTRKCRACMLEYDAEQHENAAMELRARAHKIRERQKR